MSSTLRELWMGLLSGLGRVVDVGAGGRMNSTLRAYWVGLWPGAGRVADVAR